MASPNEIEYLTEGDTVKSLKHVGRKLLRCNAPVDKLLELLDKLELLLSTVNQSPTEPIQESLVPSMKALISDEILRHTDEDVKISVISCIAEITRITAPDTPYDDEQMKEIFKLMVAAFDKLSDVSGHCYEKALAILDNVAKIRLCLVMLDLECDDLVIEMFQHFFRTVRSNHPCNAIDSMESIMTLVLDESEEVSSDLLRPVLDSIRKENQTISPISWMLAEKVITNCAIKLKPYLMRAVESSGRALDEYAQIVTSICQNGSESPQRDHSNDSHKAVVQAVENEFDIPKEADEQPTTATTKLDEPKDADEQPCDVTKELEPDNSVRGAQIMDDTKSNIRSADDSMRDDQIIKKSGSKRKLHSDLTKNSKNSNAKANKETDNLESVQESKSETHLNAVPMKRGRKPNSLMNAEEGYDHSWIRMGKKTGKAALSRKNGNSSSAFPPPENPTTRNDIMQSKPQTACEDLVSQLKKESIAKPAQSRKNHDLGSDFCPNENPASNKEDVHSKHKDIDEGETLVTEPKTDENADAGPPSSNHNIRDGSRPKRGRPRKRISRGNQDVDPNSVSMSREDNLNPQLEGTSSESPSIILKKESEERKDSEVKPHTSIRKIKFTLKSNKKTAVAPESVVAAMESKVTCEDEEKHKSGVNIEAENKEERRSSAQKEVKKRRRLNTSPNKDLNKSSAIEELIAGSASKTSGGVEEAQQTRLRRRCTTVAVEASDTRDIGHSLVGSRIKVWWPMDKTFYEGVIDSYDPVKGKHKILYADGDVEVLNLKKQRWEIIADVSPEEEQGLALHKLAEASDIAPKSSEKSALEPAKDVNIDSKSRGGACASTFKSESVKSVDTCVLDRSGLANDSTGNQTRTVSRQESAGKPKTKRMKTGSDIRKKKPKTDDLEKEKTQDA